MSIFMTAVNNITANMQLSNSFWWKWLIGSKGLTFSPRVIKFRANCALDRWENEISDIFRCVFVFAFGNNLLKMIHFEWMTFSWIEVGFGLVRNLHWREFGLCLLFMTKLIFFIMFSKDRHLNYLQTIWFFQQEFQRIEKNLNGSREIVTNREELQRIVKNLNESRNISTDREEFQYFEQVKFQLWRWKIE